MKKIITAWTTKKEKHQAALSFLHLKGRSGEPGVTAHEKEANDMKENNGSVVVFIFKSVTAGGFSYVSVTGVKQWLISPRSVDLADRRD